jgi:hypothetical protein
MDGLLGKAMWLILDTAADGTWRVAAWYRIGSIRCVSFWVRLRPVAGVVVVRGVAEGRTSTDGTAVVIGAFGLLLVDPAAGLADDRARLVMGPGASGAGLPGWIESWAFLHHVAP